MSTDQQIIQTNFSNLQEIFGFDPDTKELSRIKDIDSFDDNAIQEIDTIINSISRLEISKIQKIGLIRRLQNVKLEAMKSKWDTGHKNSNLRGNF